MQCVANYIKVWYKMAAVTNINEQFLPIYLDTRQFSLILNVQATADEETTTIFSFFLCNLQFTA